MSKFFNPSLESMGRKNVRLLTNLSKFGNIFSDIMNVEGD